MSSRSEREALMREIEQADQRLLSALEARAKLTKKLGVAGAELASPDEREATLSRVLQLANGDLPAASVRSVFEAIVTASDGLRVGRAIAFAGGTGGIHEHAVIRRFGDAPSRIATPSARDALREVSEHRAAYAVIPIESRKEGLMLGSLDALAASDLKIVGAFESAADVALMNRTGAVNVIFMFNKILSLLAFLLLLHCADAQNSLVISIFTGGDDLRTNSIAEGIIDLQDNSHLTIALNGGVGWGGGSQNTVEYLLPTGVDPSQFTGFTLTFRSGSTGPFDTGDNWNVDRITIAYQSRVSSGGSLTSSYAILAQRSGTPWVRFDGVSVRGRGYIPINYQIPAPTTASVNVRGINRVQNVSSGKFVAIGGGNLSNGALAIQWENANQLDIQWDFVPEGGNIFRIRNLNSGRFLAIEGGARTNDARALQWSDDGQADVFWELVNLGSGIYKIRNRNSGMFLSINGGSQNGVSVVQRQDGTQNSLRWRILPVTTFQTMELRGFQVFNDCNFGGAPISITEGYHRNLPAGVPNDAISAVRATNLRITLYEHNDFRGNCVVLPFGVPAPCLVTQGFNDVASSMITTRQ